MATLKIKNVSKRWGSVYGAKNINFEIQDQEFIVIVGPSGCGKTTTMRMIVGLETPTEGDIYIDDQRVNSLEPKDRDIAMVFQNYGLYPHLTVYENIRFPLKVRKVNIQEHESRVRKAAQLVELEPLINRKPKELSGGQRQRVALARAIVREPKVFLMDEPLSNLDAKLRVSTRSQLKNLQHELAVTTIYVTHDQVEAMTLADRVVVMNQGEIQQIDTPMNIYDRPANIFVASFIGSPPMNIIPGLATQGIFKAENTEIRGIPPNIEGEVCLGFRPEDAHAVKEEEKQGDIVSRVYSIELLGESTLVNFKVGSTLATIKAPKNFHAAIGDTIQIKVSSDQYHFFDTQTEKRLL